MEVYRWKGRGGRISCVPDHINSDGQGWEATDKEVMKSFQTFLPNQEDEEGKDHAYLYNPDALVLKLETQYGDFRQTLTVVPNGSRQDIVNASLCSSYIWSKCKVLSLTKNMRLSLQTANIEETANFSNWLLNIGEGKEGGANNGETTIFVYPSILENSKNPTYFQKKTILAPKNEVVYEINDRLLESFLCALFSPSSARKLALKKSLSKVFFFLETKFSSSLTGHGGNKIPRSSIGFKKSSLVPLKLPSKSCINGSVQKSPTPTPTTFVEQASSSTPKYLEFELEDAVLDNVDIVGDAVPWVFLREILISVIDGEVYKWFEDKEQPKRATRDEQYYITGTTNFFTIPHSELACIDPIHNPNRKPHSGQIQLLTTTGNKNCPLWSTRTWLKSIDS
ncbi:hypothetical protein LXL04_009769 [Taraxacum kok-saghyz]